MITSRPPNDAYRKGFSVVFGKANGSQRCPVGCQRGEHLWVLVAGEPWQCKHCGIVDEHHGDPDGARS